MLCTQFICSLPLSSVSLWLGWWVCWVFVFSDYDAKAEDAVDYENIDEEYDGPEIEAAGEEDHLLPKREYFSAEVSLATLEPTASVFDDEDYDEDFEKVHDVVNSSVEAQTIHASGFCHHSLHCYPYNITCY